MSFFAPPSKPTDRLSNAQDRLHHLTLRASTQRSRAALYFWRIVTFLLLIVELGSYFLVGYGLRALLLTVLK